MLGEEKTSLVEFELIGGTLPRSLTGVDKGTWWRPGHSHSHVVLCNRCLPGIGGGCRLTRIQNLFSSALVSK